MTAEPIVIHRKAIQRNWPTWLLMYPVIGLVGILFHFKAFGTLNALVGPYRGLDAFENVSPAAMMIHGRPVWALLIGLATGAAYVLVSARDMRRRPLVHLELRYGPKKKKELPLSLRRTRRRRTLSILFLTAFMVGVSY